jgi:SAM-dependent methyltransferase
MNGESCKICRNIARNREHLVREMMFGLRTEFSYLECSACGCLQLMDPPPDMSKYYPPTYYSLDSTKTSDGVRHRSTQYLRRSLKKAYLHGEPLVVRIVNRLYPQLSIRAFSATHANMTSQILDVGCGRGLFLLELRDLGYRNLLGIDPFISKDIDYGNRVQVRKCLLSDLTGTSWDVIMLHHSFEHMCDPRATLRAIKTLLSRDGQCLIRVPIASWAWENYGVNWVQLDAPRHFFIHTEKSLRFVAEEAGLRVVHVEYDSSEFQFWGSELYRQDLPLTSVDPNLLSDAFPKSELETFRLQSRKLNQQHRGDQAAFCLAKA